MAVTTELYLWQISPAVPLLPLTLTDRPASFSVAQSLFEIHNTATGAQGSYCYMRQYTRCSRDNHLARPLTNEKKKKEIIFLPRLVCLLRNGSVNKWYELQEGAN